MTQMGRIRRHDGGIPIRLHREVQTDHGAFFRFVLDDATFLAPRRTMAGKQAIIERWTRYFASPTAPFSWGPDRVAVNAAGTIAETAGPVYDADGHHIGNFNSVWVKQ